MRHALPTRRLATGAAIAAACAVAVPILAAPPAAADTLVCTTRYSGSFCSGEVYFEALGEHLIIKDLKKDGHGVKGYLQQYYDWKWHWVSSSNGYYNGKGFGKEVDANYSVKDGRDIRIKACLADGKNGRGYACSGWAGSRA